MGFGGGAGGDFSSLEATTFVFAPFTDGEADEVTDGEVTGTAAGTTAAVDDLFVLALYPDPLK